MELAQTPLLKWYLEFRKNDLPKPTWHSDVQVRRCESGDELKAFVLSNSFTFGAESVWGKHSYPFRFGVS